MRSCTSVEAGGLSTLGRGSCCDLISYGSSRGMMSPSSNLESTTVHCRPPHQCHLTSSSLTPCQFLPSLPPTSRVTRNPHCLAQAFINSALLPSVSFPSASAVCFFITCVLPVPEKQRFVFKRSTVRSSRLHKNHDRGYVQEGNTLNNKLKMLDWT